MRTKILQTVAILAALTAAVISFKLLQKHLTGSTGSAWFDAGCGDERSGSSANCAAVLASPYSYWPPKWSQDARPGGHLPVAFLGLVYYSSMTVWLVGVGAPSRSRRWVHLLPLLFVGAGLAVSLTLTFVMFRKLDEWCPWCAVTHLLNLLIVVCVILMWPRKHAVAQDPAEYPYPTGRQVGVTILAVFLASTAENQLLGRAGAARDAALNKVNFDQCVTVLNRLKANPNVLWTVFQSGRPSAVSARVDDPMRTFGDTGPAPFDAVVFSDFECSSCRRLAEFMDTQVAPLFGGKLRIIFKHNPLNAACNPGVGSGPHQLACEAAKAAEAARSMKGNEGFWCVHDELFRRQDQWKGRSVPVEEVAAACQIHLESLKARMESPEIIGRIREDGELAAGLGLHTTPGLFVAGRHVDHILRNEPAFWNLLADRYWKDRNEPRPESTNPATTPADPKPE